MRRMTLLVLGILLVFGSATTFTDDGGSRRINVRLSGYEETLVRRVVSMVDRSEYKRRQSPPGIKITPRALGKDRRLPITNRWRH